MKGRFDASPFHANCASKDSRIAPSRASSRSRVLGRTGAVEDKRSRVRVGALRRDLRPRPFCLCRTQPLEGGQIAAIMRRERVKSGTLLRRPYLTYLTYLCCQSVLWPLSLFVTLGGASMDGEVPTPKAVHTVECCKITSAPSTPDPADAVGGAAPGEAGL